MVREAAEKKLYDAASTGDVPTFQQLLQQDPDLLDGVSFACSNKTPLHIATMQGNLGIVEEALRRNPQLARELDSQKSSALHIAAAEGYTAIASLLLSKAPHMCWWRDCQGMNPIHIAAMNGHVEILKELIGLDPFPAREKVDGGQTVLHLCVKHRQLRAFEVLVENLGELVPAEDESGDTVLHFATRYKQKEMIQYLVENKKIDKQKRNSKGKTALDILEEIPQDATSSDIEHILWSFSVKGPAGSMKKMRDVVMVVVVLIATMAFQGVVSPPGGVWQDDSSIHKAGESVMASTHPKIYKSFIRVNTVAFVSSLIVIILLTTGLSGINLFTMMAVMCIMWMTLASIAVSYGAAETVITPNTETQSLAPVVYIVVAVSVSLLGIFILRCCYTMRKSEKINQTKGQLNA